MGGKIEEETVVDNLNPTNENDTQESIEIINQTENEIFTDYAKLLKEIRSWGWWLVGLGVMHIIWSGFLDTSWGILLIIVGLASFYFRSASMFIIYGVVLAWVAMSNFNISELWMIGLALFQVFLSVSVFLQYRRFRDVERDYIEKTGNDGDANNSSVNRVASFFPWAGAYLSCSSLIVFVFVSFVVLVIVVQTNNNESLPSYFSLFAGLVTNMGILGFSLGLASLLSRYRPKFLAITALVFGALTLLIILVMQYL